MTNTNTQFFVATVQPFQTSKYNDVSLQVPVIYEGQTYSDYCCNHHCSCHGNQQDETQYQVAELGSAVKGVFTGIADIIRACRTPSSGSAAATSTATSTSATSTGVDTSKNDKKADQTQVDELTSLIQTEESGKTVDTQKVDFAAKWGKIDIEHEPQCKAYEDAVKNGDTAAQKVNEAKLKNISNTVEDKIKELEKDLKGENVSDADKTIGRQALDQLNKIKARIDEALKTKAPEKSEKADDSEEIKNAQLKEQQYQSDLDELKRKKFESSTFI